MAVTTLAGGEAVAAAGAEAPPMPVMASGGAVVGFALLAAAGAVEALIPAIPSKPVPAIGAALVVAGTFDDGPLTATLPAGTLAELTVAEAGERAIPAIPAAAPAPATPTPTSPDDGGDHRSRAGQRTNDVAYARHRRSHSSR